MLEKAKKLDQHKKAVSVLIYGAAGVGKTYSLAGLPESSTLIVDTDKGLATIADKKFDVIVPESMEEVLELLDDLHTKEHKYKYVVFDSLSELDALLLEFVTSKAKKTFAELKQHGDKSQILRRIIRMIRDLTHNGINIIAICREFQAKVEESEGGFKSTTSPLIGDSGGKFSQETAGMFDAVGRLVVVKGGKRVLWFGPSDSAICKSRVQGLEGEQPNDMKVVFSKVS